MRIGLLTSVLSTGNRRERACHGVGFYTWELLKAMVEADERNEFVLISEKPLSLDEPLRSNPRVREVSMDMNIPGITKFGLWREWVMAREHIDLLHEPEPSAGIIRFSRYPLVVSIFDVIPMLFADYFCRIHRWTFRSFVPRNLARADAIIASSENTLRDMEAMFPGIAKKTTVIHGAGQSFDPPTHSDAERTYVSKPYILTVATNEPRKNLFALLDAYHIMRTDGLDMKLVLTGPEGWKNEAIFRHPALSLYPSDITFTGIVPPERLAQLYRNASLFVYPSLYEGFGMPPLEALSAGVPVVVGRNSSFPEVLGEAAHYLSERPNGKEIARAASTLMNDPEQRAKLSATGMTRADNFSWRKTAQETLHVYEDVLRRRRC